MSTNKISLSSFLKQKNKINFKKKIINKFRDNKKNTQEYNIEKYKVLFEKIRNQDIKTYSNFLKIALGKSSKQVILENNKLVEKNNMYFYNKLIQSIYYELKKYIKLDNKINIVELGAGYGRISFSLLNYKKIKIKKYYLYEFTFYGRKILNLINKKFNYDCKISSCDFNNKKIIKIKPPKNSVVITCNTIMQIPRLKKDFFLKIIKLEPKIVFHFEPVFTSNNSSKLNKLSQKYGLMNDYNMNFFNILKSLEKEKKIKIINYNSNFIRNNLFLPTAVVVWKPIKY